MKQSFRREQKIDKRGSVNKGIKAQKVRVIDSDGAQLGIFMLDAAIKLAEGKGLDLVEVSSKSDPPVCRIMDYGKFKYEQSKKAHESKKKQSVVVIKEMKFRPKTEEHDLNFKIRHLEKFLTEGYKVKVTIRFRGREMHRTELGAQVLELVADRLREIGVIEQQPKMEGRNMTMLMVPIKDK